MAVIKKKVKQNNSKNTYAAHKIRSHPFYFITLPLKVSFFFIFYWIVLVPVIYYILLTFVPTFPPFSLYYFIAAFIVFLLILALFIAEWRLKKNKENTDIYYIKYESPELTKTLDIEQQLHDVTLRQKSREMIYLTDRKQNHTKVERPPDLLIEDYDKRPISSPLTPREQFFYDMYEIANKNIREITSEFIENEKLYYVPSGPVSRDFTSNDNSSVNQLEKQSSILDQSPLHEQYPVEEQSCQNPDDEQNEFKSSDDQFPVSEQYPLEEPYLKSQRSSSDDQNQIRRYEHSPLLKILQEHVEDREESTGPSGHIEVVDIEGGREFFIASVESTENCVTEAFLIVNESEPDKKPAQIIVDLRESN